MTRPATKPSPPPHPPTIADRKAAIALARRTHAQRKGVRGQKKPTVIYPDGDHRQRKVVTTTRPRDAYFPSPSSTRQVNADHREILAITNMTPPATKPSPPPHPPTIADRKAAIALARRTHAQRKGVRGQKKPTVIYPDGGKQRKVVTTTRPRDMYFPSPPSPRQVIADHRAIVASARPRFMRDNKSSKYGVNASKY